MDFQQKKKVDAGPARFTKVGNFVLHHKGGTSPSLPPGGGGSFAEYANEEERRAAARGYRFSTIGGSSMSSAMRATAAVMLSLCFFVAVAAGGTKYVLRSASHRDDDAVEELRSMGYRYRLSEEVLRYDLDYGAKVPRNKKAKAAMAAHGKYVRAFDGAMPASALSHLRSVFCAESQFW